MKQFRMPKIGARTIACMIGGALLLGGVAGCGGGKEEASGGSSSEIQTSVETEPKLTIPKDKLEGKVREAVELPAATATDERDGDISSSITVNVYYSREMEYVFPSSSPSDTVDGSVANAFIPQKVGDYLVTYSVRNSLGKKQTIRIPLTVAANDMEREQQLVLDKENWILSGNNLFNVDDELEFVSTSGSSISYGKKLKSGDLFSFRFSATAQDTMFYSVNAHMSSSYLSDAPSESESVNGFPARLNLRVLASRVETYVGCVNNKNMAMSFGESVSARLLDGKDHTISMRNTLTEIDGEKAVKTELWIDSSATGVAPNISTIKESDMRAYYGDLMFEEYFKNMFDEEKFGGFFNIGSYQGKGNDKMTIKSFSINNEQYINAPMLVAPQPEKSYLVNEEITFAAARSEDQNDYSDLSSKVKIFVSSPAGQYLDKNGKIVEVEAKTVALDGVAYIPVVSGEHSVTYVVADASGNRAKSSYKFLVSKELSETPPTIEFAEGALENLKAKVGEEFVLPIPSSVRDSFGADLTSRLSVQLLGGEATGLNGRTEYTFKLGGAATIRYSVEDDNGNKTERDVKVDVASYYEAGDLPLTTAFVDSHKADNVTADGIQLYRGFSGAITSQKIYSEKIFIRMKVNIATAPGRSDGFDIFMINVRGGKNQDSIPSSSLSFDWPNGLNIELTGDGNGVVRPCYGVHTDSNGLVRWSISDYHALFSEEVVLGLQVTDEYDGDTFKGIKLEMWIYDSKGALAFENSLKVSAREIGENTGFLQAGWLSFYGYISDNSSYQPTDDYIYAITIDGSMPVKNVAVATSGSFVVGTRFDEEDLLLEEKRTC